MQEKKKLPQKTVICAVSCPVTPVGIFTPIWWPRYRSAI